VRPPSISLMLMATLISFPAAGAELVDGAELNKRIFDITRAPVVDARDTADRSMLPVPGALVYQRNMPLDAVQVIVIADTDSDALVAAEQLESMHSRLKSYALSGGYDTLRLLLPDAKLPARADSIMPPVFTIPSDTCQTGPALHIYEAR